MTQIQVGTNPVQLQQSNAYGWTLQNAGTGNLYIDQNASVSPSTGYLVLPGISVPMSVGAVVWAVSDSSTTVGLMQGISASLSSNVEISGPVSVAGNIDAQIVNVPGVNVVPNYNALIPLTPVSVSYWNSTQVNVNGSPSIYVVCTSFPTIPSNTIYDGSYDTQMQVLWYDSNLNLLTDDYFYFSGQLFGVIPAKGPIFEIALSVWNGANISGSLNVYGIGTSFPKHLFHNARYSEYLNTFTSFVAEDRMAQTGSLAFNFTIPVNTSGIIPIPFHSGNSYIGWARLEQTTAGNSFVALGTNRTIGTDIYHWREDLSAAGQVYGQSVPILADEGQIYLVAGCSNGATATVVLSLLCIP